LGQSDKDTRFNHDLDVSDTEVTRGQFAEFVRVDNFKTLAERAVVEPRGSFVPAGDVGKWVETVNWMQTGADGDELPVTCVCWEDAVALSSWNSKFAGKDL